jgi:hypothetical protein
MPTILADLHFGRLERDGKPLPQQNGRERQAAGYLYVLWRPGNGLCRAELRTARSDRQRPLGVCGDSSDSIADCCCECGADQASNLILPLRWERQAADSDGNVERIKLQTSFCPHHRHYWTWRYLLIFGGLAGFFAVLIGGFTCVGLLIGVAKVDKPWVSAFVIGPVLLYLVAWIIPTKLITQNSIRVRLLADDAVELQNVDQRYIDAVKAQREPSHPSDATTIPTAILIVDPRQAPPGGGPLTF